MSDKQWTLADPLVQQFKREVHNNAEAIDLSDGQDWYSITLGWAIGKGLSPAEAHAFALFIRYDTELG